MDALYLLFVLLGAYALRTRPTVGGEVAAGVLFTLAYLTKQTALMIALPLILYALWHGRGGRRVLFGAVFGALALGVTGLLHAASAGWSSYYLLDLPGGHSLLFSRLVTFWTEDLVRTLPMVVGALYFLVADRERRLFYGALAAGAVGSAWLSRIHSGGHINVLLPALAVGVLLAVLGGWRLLDDARTRGEASRPWALGLWAVVVVQFALLVYDPRAQLPTAADRAAGDQVVAELRGVPGDVWAPGQGYLARRAGKPVHSHIMALSDVVRGDPRGEGERVSAEILTALDAGRFEAVLFPYRDCASDNRYAAICEMLDLNYDDPERLLEGAAMRPVAGTDIRPLFLYPRASRGASE